VDNTLAQTFLYLFTKQEVVIDSYITGEPRRYLNPSSYPGIALTLPGITVFLMGRVFGDKINMNIYH
jgi:hypothetical protein